MPRPKKQSANLRTKSHEVNVVQNLTRQSSHSIIIITEVWGLDPGVGRKLMHSGRFPTTRGWGEASFSHLRSHLPRNALQP